MKSTKTLSDQLRQTSPSSPGGRGGGWEKRAGVMRAGPKARGGRLGRGQRGEGSAYNPLPSGTRSASPRAGRKSNEHHTRHKPHQSPRRREQSISPAAPAQPGRLVSLERGGDREGPAGGQADLPLGGVLDLLLVPRHGAGVVLEPAGRGA